MTARYSESTRDALQLAWNVNAANANLERWLDICEHEGWSETIENLPLLAKLFGASWYFTRLVFFRGLEIKKYFDDMQTDPDFSKSSMLEFIRDNDIDSDLEDRFERLRLAKNEIMLQILLFQLTDRLDDEQSEVALSHLAEITLQLAVHLVMDVAEGDPLYPAILAMGRMAGKEMNYGSDLDLIFLYSGESSEHAALTRRIQLLLRHIATPTACGLLYEIDMRLRPHGTSGTLISPASYFIEYHSEDRDIWERQMMTRCRPVVDENHLASEALSSISSKIYAIYDQAHLRKQILDMRFKVEKELGNPKGKFEIKRGPGGIMDIDFLTHFLQLGYGHEFPELKTASTRNALRQLGNKSLLTGDQVGLLLQSYDFLKRVEGVLRVADLKSVSAFSQDPEQIQTLARAMGYARDAGSADAEGFIDEYLTVTGKVRNCFTDVVGEYPGSGL